MNTTELQHRLRGQLEAARQALDSLIQAQARRGEREGGAAFQPEGFEIAHFHARFYALDALFADGEQDETPANTAASVSAALSAAFAAESLEAFGALLPRLSARLEVSPTLDTGEWGALAAAVRSEDFQGPVIAGLETLGGHNTGGALGMAGLSDEHTLLRETFHTFAERKVKPVAESLHREDRLIPDTLIAEAAALGCFGLSIPAEYGGAAERPDNLGMVVVTEELSRGALIVGSLITRPEILAKALLSGGTPEQRARFLPAMATGEKMVAIAVTEPDFGSDVANINTTATRVQEGWRINGAKVWSTFAGRGELIGLLARTEQDTSLGHRGLGMFVVDKPAFHGHDFEHSPDGGGTAGGGLLRGRAIPTLGYRGMHSFELHFEDYFLPAEALVGGEAGRGRGFYLQMESFSNGRLQTSGRALGLTQAAFEEALAYGAERRVFGNRLNAYALTQAKLVRMAANILAGRKATYAAARLLDAGAGQMEASLVKLFTCRNAEWITREAMQMHGGMGYAEEFAVSRYFADARVLSIFEGAEEVLALKVILPALLKSRV